MRRIAVLAAVLLAGMARAAEPKQPVSLPVGAGAPAFALFDVNGRRHAPAEEADGRPLILNFWAFWCDTWKDEMPHLTELAKEQEAVGFRIVAVSVDGTRLSEFMDRTGGKTPFPVLLDPGGKVSALYRVRRVPTVVIVDASGQVRFTASGYPGNHVVLNELRKLTASGESRKGAKKAAGSRQQAAQRRVAEHRGAPLSFATVRQRARSRPFPVPCTPSPAP